MVRRMIVVLVMLGVLSGVAVVAASPAGARPSAPHAPEQAYSRKSTSYTATVDDCRLQTKIRRQGPDYEIWGAARCTESTTVLARCFAFQAQWLNPAHLDPNNPAPGLESSSMDLGYSLRHSGPGPQDLGEVTSKETLSALDLSVNPDVFLSGVCQYELDRQTRVVVSSPVLGGNPRGSMYNDMYQLGGCMATNSCVRAATPSLSSSLPCPMTGVVTWCTPIVSNVVGGWNGGVSRPGTTTCPSGVSGICLDPPERVGRIDKAADNGSEDILVPPGDEYYNAQLNRARRTGNWEYFHNQLHEALDSLIRLFNKHKAMRQAGEPTQALRNQIRELDQYYAKVRDDLDRYTS